MTKLGKSYDAELERVELGLLAADVQDAARGLGVRPSGLLGIITLPLGGFAAEESFAYFDVRNRKRMGSLDGPLLEEFRHSLKKIRARLKLFDASEPAARNSRCTIKWPFPTSRATCSTSRASKWLKELVGVDELDDQEVADAEAAADDVQEIEIADSAWHSIAEQHGLRAPILEVAESAVLTYPGDPCARHRMLQQFIHDELACSRGKPRAQLTASDPEDEDHQRPGPPGAGFREFPF